MIERQFMSRETIMTILAGKIIPQKDIEPGERRTPDRRDIFFQGNNAGKANALRGRADLHIIFAQNRDTIEKNRLHTVLPRPERQRKIGQRPEICVQNECRTLDTAIRQDAYPLQEARWISLAFGPLIITPWKMRRRELLRVL